MVDKIIVDDNLVCDPALNKALYYVMGYQSSDEFIDNYDHLGDGV